MADCMKKQKVGTFDLVSLDDGGFRLDGGAMHGVVPRILWSRENPPDELNRISMRARPLLVRGPFGNLLIEAGLGDVGDDVFHERYAVEQPRGLIHGLSQAGISPEEIDFVALTHLHWDHAGGLVHTGPEGGVRLTFPGAVHFIQERAWQDAFRPGPRAGSFHPDRLEPLEGNARLELVTGDAEILPGVRLVPAGGHGDGHAVVLMSSGGKTAVFLADLVPISSQFKTNWIMAFDLQPARTAEDKQALLTRAHEENWLQVLYHDDEIAFGTLSRDEGGRFVLDPC